MFILLEIVWIFLSLALIGIVLLQRGRGGGLVGALGGAGGNSAFGTKAGDVFTKITVGLFGAWLLTAIILIWIGAPTDLVNKVGTASADAAAKKDDGKKDDGKKVTAGDEKEKAINPPPPPPAKGSSEGIKAEDAAKLAADAKAAPKVDPAKSEPPKAEPAKTEPPKADAPKADAGKTAAPKAEPPKADAGKAAPPPADAAKK